MNNKNICCSKCGASLLHAKLYRVGGNTDNAKILCINCLIKDNDIYQYTSLDDVKNNFIVKENENGTQ